MIHLKTTNEILFLKCRIVITRGFYNYSCLPGLFLCSVMMVVSQNALRVHMGTSVQTSVEYVKTIPRVIIRLASV